MSENIIKKAKQILLNSDVMNYIPIERLEQAFSKVKLAETEEKFFEAYGYGEYRGEKLEGYNRFNETNLNPRYATPHTVIHEVLHDISSIFDKDGNRIQNGLMGTRGLGFDNQINEGATDYLASKLSGEKARNYYQGHKLFEKLEPMLIKYTKNENILMQMYLTNDVKFMEDFLNYFGNKEYTKEITNNEGKKELIKQTTFEKLYSDFLFMNDEKIDELLKPVNKNLNKFMKKQERKEKRNNFLNKIKTLFSKKDTIKLLQESNNTYQDISTLNNDRSGFVSELQKGINPYEDIQIDEYENQNYNEKDIER